MGTQMIFRKEPGIIFDSLQMMVMKLNDQALWSPEFFNQNQATEDMNYLNYWRNQFDKPKLQLSLFFHLKNRIEPNFMSKAFKHLMSLRGAEIKFNDLLGYISNETEFTKDLLVYYLGKNIQGEQEIEEAIRQQNNLPQIIKFYLLGFILNKNAYIDSLRNCLIQYYEQVAHVYKGMSEELLLWAESVNEAKIQKLISATDNQARTRKKPPLECVVYSFMIINRTQIFSNIDYVDNWILLGYDFERNPENDLLKIDLATFANALGDKHRMAIIDILLKDKRTTCIELADKLGLAVNTVSYHLFIMKKANLLYSKAEGKAQYYQLNPQPFYENAVLCERIANGGIENTTIIL